ncbi:V/A-type H+-transporting ATPase subunit C [Catenibacillus scindens]|uniref:V/A-type H+-transporting ATPase subunit C n=1 Tax=Catenibacillus scindens TaxID=673271 RepID=A0A7W8HBI5_9FIRM|nr:V-type ATPase subunit [Catenibacillus scindens]MBB5264695.1 V/A-type H+-transporting ATPase subunit C [Catenibacillus scindens]
MNNALMNYSGISAKVRAMKGRLLDREAYYNIASMQSVPEFLSWIKTVPSYIKVFESVPETVLHRGEIEKLLQLALYDDYARIYAFAGPDQRKFLKVYFRRYEIQIVKTFLHLIFDHRDILFDTSLIPPHFRDQSSISLDALSRCKSLDEFFEVIEHSDYYPLLKALKDRTDVSLFDYELALDIYFFKFLWKLKDKVLKAWELEQMTKIYGTQIDLLNILWIYRSKRFYQVEPSQMYSNLIPVHFRLTPSYIRRLIESETLDEYRELLGRSFYGRALTSVEQSAADSDTALWRMYQEIMRNLRRQAARKYPYSLAVIEEYLFLREEEINRLTTAMECIRYGLDADQTLRYVQST